MFKSLIAQHYQAQGILPDGILAQVSDALRLDEAPHEYDIEWQVVNNNLTPIFVCYDLATEQWIQRNRHAIKDYASQFIKVKTVEARRAEFIKPR